MGQPQQSRQLRLQRRQQAALGEVGGVDEPQEGSHSGQLVASAALGQGFRHQLLQQKLRGA